MFAEQIKKLDQRTHKQLEYIRNCELSQIKNARRTARNREVQAKEARSSISLAIENYDKRRVFVIDDQITQALSVFEQTPKDFAKELAEAYKRVFIHMYRETANHYTTQSGWKQFNRSVLEVSRTKRMENVISALLMVAVDDPHAHAVPRNNYLQGNPVLDQPLTMQASPRKWIFYFYGDQGAALLEGFLERAETDPVFRIIVGK